MNLYSLSSVVHPFLTISALHLIRTTIRPSLFSASAGNVTCPTEHECDCLSTSSSSPAWPKLHVSLTDENVTQIQTVSEPTINFVYDRWERPKKPVSLCEQQRLVNPRPPLLIGSARVRSVGHWVWWSPPCAAPITFLDTLSFPVLCSLMVGLCLFLSFES